MNTPLIAYFLIQVLENVARMRAEYIATKG